MKKLIKLSDTHYVIVDDSEIKGNDFGWDVYEKKIFQAIINWKGQTKNRYFKITHSFGKQLEGVINKPLSEVEEVINGYSVEKMADNDCSGVGFPEESHRQTAIKGYIQGFKAHQELVKDKLFTRENLWWAYVRGFQANEEKKQPLKDFEDVKQSLQKTEWDIEIVNNKIKLI